VFEEDGPAERRALGISQRFNGDRRIKGVPIRLLQGETINRSTPRIPLRFRCKLLGHAARRYTSRTQPPQPIHPTPHPKSSERPTPSGTHLHNAARRSVRRRIRAANVERAQETVESARDVSSTRPIRPFPANGGDSLPPSVLMTVAVPCVRPSDIVRYSHPFPDQGGWVP
jgi:hypothetical protein